MACLSVCTTRHFRPPISGFSPRITVMTKEEFFEQFSLDELEQICTKNEFLNVLVADRFDAAQAASVARRILDLHPTAFPDPWPKVGGKQPGSGSLHQEQSWLRAYRGNVRPYWHN